MTVYEHPPVAGPMNDVETERLHLQRFHLDHLDGLAEVFAHQEVWQFPYGRAFSREEAVTFISAQIDHWQSCNFGLWMSVHRELGQVMGYVGLAVPMFLPEVLPAVEVGWRFSPTFWGKGYAAEGARAALREAFITLQLDEVTSLPQVDNTASVRVCERLGMRFDRDIPLPANERRGSVVASLFVMSKDEWLAATPH